MSATAELAPQTRQSIEKTRTLLDEARHLLGFFYTSREIFQREIDTTFMREWLCVGRIEEFEKPGDYHAMRIVGEPLVLCRGSDGELQAFRNLCQHRGVEVAVGQGNAQRFTCRYHAWTYGTDGRLTGAPHSQNVADFDFMACRLPLVRLDTWGGYVFVNFDPDCRPLNDCLDEDGVRDFAAFLQPENTRTSDKFEFYESLTMAPNGVTLFGQMPWLDGRVTDKFVCTT